MGQRSSVQQPGADVAHRPRTSSDISNGLASRHQRHRSNNQRSRFQQNDTSSSSSSPSNRTSTDEDNRSEEDGAGDLNFASILMSHLGLSSGVSPSTTGPSNSAQRTNVRRSEGGSTLNNGFFHNRNPRTNRFGGSQRSRRALVSNSTSSAGELLSSGRLEALLRGMEDSLSASNSASSSSMRVMGTQKQQAALGRLRQSLPLLQLIGRDIKCPVCHKIVPLKDVEMHLVMCFTRPVLSYNDDVLTADKGECSICLEDMSEGDNIARLPCLCIYHKICIDEWFKRKNTCPEHPPVEDD
uniref:E3 ubiquitin-protein ligase ZNRF1 n=1 Tax=Meloidogyne incognita TaxID=6306 RepID=A0A914L453_MELIC